MEFVYLGCSLVFVLVAWYFRKTYFLIPALLFCLPIIFTEYYDQYFRAGVIVYFVIILVPLCLDTISQVFD